MSESPNQEPVRWLEDPSAAAALRADLGHAARAGAGGVDYAATLVALRGAIASQTGAMAPAAVAGKSIGLKAVVGGLVIGGVAGLWALRSEPDPTASGGGAARPAQVVEAERIEPTPGRAPAPPERPAAVPSIAAPVPASPAAPRTEDAPIVADVPAIEAGKPSRRPRVDSTPSAPESIADDAMREAKLVALARKQLGTDPAKALASTQQHGRDFPRGVLVEERRAIEVRALAQLDRMEEARRAAEAFLREFGDGPHAAAVRRAVAGDDPGQ
jgi:hypothetical protein